MFPPGRGRNMPAEKEFHDAAGARRRLPHPSPTFPVP